MDRPLGTSTTTARFLGEASQIRAIAGKAPNATVMAGPEIPAAPMSGGDNRESACRRSAGHGTGLPHADSYGQCRNRPTPLSMFPACSICLRAIATSSQRPTWKCPSGFQRKVIAQRGNYADCAPSLARRARAVCIATAPSRIMAPIGMAASSGRTSATHTTRLPPISRAYTCTAPL